MKSIKANIKIIKDDAKIIKDGFQKLTEIIQNNKTTSDLNCQWLGKKYDINFPISSRDDLDKFKKKLNKKEQFCRHCTCNSD